MTKIKRHLTVTKAFLIAARRNAKRATEAAAKMPLTRKQIIARKKNAFAMSQLPRTKKQIETCRRNGKAVGLLPKTDKQRDAARRNALKTNKKAVAVAASLPRTKKQMLNMVKAQTTSIKTRNNKNGYCDSCKTHCKIQRDHCHKTGKRRGDLCFHCNVGIGYFKDRPKLLRKAARYLERWVRRHAN